MVTCVSGNENCNNEKQCTAKLYWQELNELIISNMSAQSLQDLVDKHIKMSKQRKKHIMYYIKKHKYDGNKFQIRNITVTCRARH